MTDEMRVTVIVTGLGDVKNRGQQANAYPHNKSRVLESALRSDGTFDYQQLDRPAVLRKQASLVKPSAAQTAQAASLNRQKLPPVSAEAAGVPDTDYLDIPAFLRRKEECID